MNSFYTDDFPQKIEWGDLTNGPLRKLLSRAIRYSGLGVRSVGPVRDFWRFDSVRSRTFFGNSMLIGVDWKHKEVSNALAFASSEILRAQKNLRCHCL